MSPYSSDGFTWAGVIIAGMIAAENLNPLTWRPPVPRFLSLLLLSTIGATALAQDYPAWLADVANARNPDQLDYWYSHSGDCPFTEQEATAVIEGVIVRSRVKPVH